MCCYLEEGSSSGGGKPCGKNAKVGKMCKNHHKRMVEGRGMLDAVGQAVVCGVVGGGGGGGGMMMMAGGTTKIRMTTTIWTTTGASTSEWSERILLGTRLTSPSSDLTTIRRRRRPTRERALHDPSRRTDRGGGIRSGRVGP